MTLQEHIEALVTVQDGNTEINACYYEVKLLKHVVWSRGGSYPETKDAAERFAQALRRELVEYLR